MKPNLRFCEEYVGRGATDPCPHEATWLVRVFLGFRKWRERRVCSYHVRYHPPEFRVRRITKEERA